MGGLSQSDGDDDAVAKSPTAAGRRSIAKEICGRNASDSAPVRQILARHPISTSNIKYFFSPTMDTLIHTYSMFDYLVLTFLSLSLDPLQEIKPCL